MYISLRKAAALQKEILAAVPAIRTTVDVSIYDKLPVAIIAQAALDATKAMELRSMLMNALYEIRDAVAVANVNTGVTQLVSRLARVDKDIATFTSLLNSTVRPSETTILAKLERQANADQSHYSFNENVNFAVLQQASMDSVKLTLTEYKKEKVRIQDQLLEANIKNTIKLSEETVAVLTAQALI